MVADVVEADSSFGSKPFCVIFIIIDKAVSCCLEAVSFLTVSKSAKYIYWNFRKDWS